MSQNTNRPLGDYELLECVERGLDRFGSSIKYTVMWRMVVLGDAPKEGILVKPSAFVKALVSIFGHSANLIEQAVYDEVRARVGLEAYPGIDNLADLINAIRKQTLIEQIIS